MLGGLLRIMVNAIHFSFSNWFRSFSFLMHDRTLGWIVGWLACRTVVQSIGGVEWEIPRCSIASRFDCTINVLVRRFLIENFKLNTLIASLKWSVDFNSINNKAETTALEHISNEISFLSFIIIGIICCCFFLLDFFLILLCGTHL